MDIPLRAYTLWSEGAKAAQGRVQAKQEDGEMAVEKETEGK
jgi:hypothetical protein